MVPPIGHQCGSPPRLLPRQELSKWQFGKDEHEFEPARSRLHLFDIPFGTAFASYSFPSAQERSHAVELALPESGLAFGRRGWCGAIPS
jgi:hypothetical protein